ncbi:hypothetical protein EOL70_02210 [Leucothrix sargassi]|nr:hypothetical protein EOL70_02210 [Leucothrix sargassi]
MILESPFSSELRLDVNASRSVAALILVPLCFIAVVIIFLTPVSIVLKLLILALLVLSAAHYLKLHYWQTAKRSVSEFNIDANGQWSVLCEHLPRQANLTQWVQVSLDGSTFSSRFLIVLNLVGEGQRFTILLPKDSLDQDTFRRLRVRLKMHFAKVKSKQT